MDLQNRLIPRRDALRGLLAGGAVVVLAAVHPASAATAKPESQQVDTPSPSSATYQIIGLL